MPIVPLCGILLGVDLCSGCLGSSRCWVCLGTGCARPFDLRGVCLKCRGSGRCQACRRAVSRQATPTGSAVTPAASA